MITVALMVGCGKTTAPQNTLMVRANDFYVQGKYPEAREAIDSLLTEEPNNFEARSLRGQIHKKWGKADEAIKDFTKLIALDPTRPDGYAFRSQLYEDKKRSIENESGTGSELWLKFHELAQADRRQHYANDPTSVDALKAPTRRSRASELINKPLPGYDPLAETEEDSLAEKDDTDSASDFDAMDGGNEMAEDPFVKLAEPLKPEDGDPENGIGDLGDPLPKKRDPLNPARTLTKVNGEAELNAEDEIAERDLALNENGDLEDDPLPHGDDPEGETRFAPQVVRNNLEAFLPPLDSGPVIEPFLPQRGPSTTGITSPEYERGGAIAQGGPRGAAVPDTNGLNPNAPTFITPRNQTGFTSVNPFPLPGTNTQTPRRSTGFNSTRVTTPQSAPNSPYPWIQGLTGSTRTANTGVNGSLSGRSLSGPAGFLPEGARGQFGPRLGVAAPASPNRPAQDGDTSTESRIPIPTTRPTSPPLSMALPGTAQGAVGAPLAPGTTGAPISTGVPITAGGTISNVNPFDRSLAPNLPPTVLQTTDLPLQ